MTICAFCRPVRAPALSSSARLRDAPPTADEPTNEIMRTSGCSTKRLPTLGPSPVTRLTTRAAAASHARRFSAENGVSGAGFNTTTCYHTPARETLPGGNRHRKFRSDERTPMGLRSATSPTLNSRRPSPPAKYAVSIPSCTSPRSARIFPISRVISRYAPCAREDRPDLEQIPARLCRSKRHGANASWRRDGVIHGQSIPEGADQFGMAGLRFFPRALREASTCRYVVEHFWFERWAWIKPSKLVLWARVASMGAGNSLLPKKSARRQLTPGAVRTTCGPRPLPNHNQAPEHGVAVRRLHAKDVHARRDALRGLVGEIPFDVAAVAGLDVLPYQIAGDREYPDGAIPRDVHEAHQSVREVVVVGRRQSTPARPVRVGPRTRLQVVLRVITSSCRSSGHSKGVPSDA